MRRKIYSVKHIALLHHCATTGLTSDKEIAGAPNKCKRLRFIQSNRCCQGAPGEVKGLGEAELLLPLFLHRVKVIVLLC